MNKILKIINNKLYKSMENKSIEKCINLLEEMKDKPNVRDYTIPFNNWIDYVIWKLRQ